MFDYIHKDSPQIAVIKSTYKEGKPSLLKKIEERLIKIEQESGPQEWSK